MTTACGDSADETNDDQQQPTGEQPAVADHENVSCSDGLCSISGAITEDLTIPNDDELQFLLSGPVFVGDEDPSTETIFEVEPGVTVFAETGTSDSASFLAVRRGSKIMAEGTEEEPIVFTTSAEEGSRGRGLWGGLILNGRAPLNVGDTAEGEGSTGTFGGDDPEDSSGVLKYVRVEFAGTLITSDNELNGIAFQGVGRGTTIDHVQVHMNKDDGVEFFGGTARAKHLVLTGIGDDSLDWTDGWRGGVQHVVIQQYGDNADRGIEADNLSDNNDATPRSKPTLANLTIIGPGTDAQDGDAGILLRRGTGANIHNTIVTSAAASCLDVDNQATFANAWDGDAGEYTGELTIDNSIISGCSQPFADDEQDFTPPFTVQEWFEAGEGNEQTDPGLRAPTAEQPDYRIEADSAADRAGSTPGGWYDETDYIGAVGPDQDWTSGWTIHATE
jgi:hypothetical protein